ncbi:protein nlrc3 [Plasmopara halstedii]|uniref:Protein nlrc3 n=1 Tax=Plasmopara halstedii TaxID=4781 RepID=A0A0N7L4M0_PLAHL|nr:protein nlrc3 [Plasmopara halstedii]CEG39051.1 protein nlrc3 [Plasmopara halstedii]|eukprot:XP_024575420.1 protein nlrc3 [Plasmopara halstedii]
MIGITDSDEQEDHKQNICVDVDEAIYLLTMRHPVFYDDEALKWKCLIPAKSSIDTMFGKVVYLALRSYDGVLICSHPFGTAYLVGLNIVQTRKGSFLDSKVKSWEEQSLELIRRLDLRGSLTDPMIMTHLSRGIGMDRFITTLSLNGNHLTDAEIIPFAYELGHNRCLLELTLSYNAIGEIGSASLAKALATNSSLQLLDLTHNRISKDGIIPWLGDTMRVNRSLLVLKLSHNGIGDKKAVELFQALSPKPLTEEERLKVQLAKRLKYALTNTRSVESYGEKDRFNSTLQTLLLSNTGLSDEVSAPLAHLLRYTCSLTHLDISCNEFTSQGNVNIARGLQQNTSIRYLNYRENKLDEVAALAVLGALKSHSVLETALFQDCFGADTTVGSALAELIANTQSLTTLDLSYCSLKPIEAVKLHTALADSTSLRSIDLTCSGINSDNAAATLATSLQQNTTLTFVDLSYNKITLRGCKLLRDVIAHRSNTSSHLVLSLEGNTGEKCPIASLRVACKPLLSRFSLFVCAVKVTSLNIKSAI